MEKIKVLIVEDDNELATMYKIKFEKEWMDVKIADNWLIAVSEVTNFKPNIILLDIMMPSMDGFETLRVIRQLAPSLESKIIMFSNLNSKEDIDRCMNSWADAYLLKANTTPWQAVEKINELLWRKEEKIDTNFNWKKHTQITCSCPHCNKDIHIKLDINC